MGLESPGVVRLELGSLIQAQMRIATLKCAYNRLIIDPRLFRFVNFVHCLFH